jgi:hypothetical protein
MKRGALMNPILNVVMAYEDVSLAKLAKEKWDSLVNNSLQDNFEIDLRLWRFDALRIPELRKVAVDEAANAQIVFVVTHGTGELPFEVKDWVEQWLAQINQEEASRLLALLAVPPPSESGATNISQLAYLQRAARKGSMDFLASTASN